MKWTFAKQNLKQVNLDYEIPEIILRLLVSRGFDTKGKIDKFLNPSLDQLHDPFLLPDMENAVRRIEQALKRKEKIAVYGDYDADGITATSIIWDFFYRQLKADIVPYIPSRSDEGYGLNTQALVELESKGVKLVITVDCGIKDSKLIKQFPNMAFVITDHHTLPEDEHFPYPAVHPKRKISKYPFKELAGAGVAWKLIDAIRISKKLPHDTSYKYLPFAAIGTVCDIMPLLDENRVIVKFGLDYLDKNEMPGLVELAKISGVGEEKIKAYHIGYLLGPRINASGRLSNALKAVKLLVTKNKNQAQNLAKELNDLNLERQSKTHLAVSQAIEIVKDIQSDENLIFLFNQAWHEGVVGLIAGKLTDAFHKPAICLTKVNGKWVGSARSITAFDITKAIEKYSNMLIRYGGHAQAAGLSIDEANIQEFASSIQKHAKENIKEIDLAKTIEIDQEVELGQLNVELFDWFDKMEPFGNQNFKPIVAIKNLKILRKSEIGREKQHVKMVLKDESGRTIEALGFSQKSELAGFNQNDTIDIAGLLNLNKFNNQDYIQIIIKDIKNVKEDN